MPAAQKYPNHPLEFSGAFKGALRIPIHSFQLLRRPGCAAKLLYFLHSRSFDPDDLFPHLYEK